MVLITYENFRDVECEFVKYVSRKRSKFKINIIFFPEFKKHLVGTYSEEQIMRFFRLFPYALDSEVSSADKLMSIKLEIEFYADLRLIEFNGREFVLVDHSTEVLEGLKFLTEVRRQPTLLEEFATISFLDFVLNAQEDLYSSMEYNLVEREDSESKSVDNSSKNWLYI